MVFQLMTWNAKNRLWQPPSPFPHVAFSITYRSSSSFITIVVSFCFPTTRVYLSITTLSPNPTTTLFTLSLSPLSYPSTATISSHCTLVMCATWQADGNHMSLVALHLGGQIYHCGDEWMNGEGACGGSSIGSVALGGWELVSISWVWIFFTWWGDNLSKFSASLLTRTSMPRISLQHAFASLY